MFFILCKVLNISSEQGPADLVEALDKVSTPPDRNRWRTCTISTIGDVRWKHILDRRAGEQRLVIWPTPDRIDRLCLRFPIESSSSSPGFEFSVRGLRFRVRSFDEAVWIEDVL